MAEVPAAEPSGGGSDAPIFVSDASAEAERLTEALRQRGYTVVDVPLGLVLGRLAAQRPALILCDADATGALETIARLREVKGGESVEVIFIGEAGRTLEDQADAFFHEASGAFVRPVDVSALLRKVEALVGAPKLRASGSLSHQLSRSPVLVASARKPYRHEGGADSLPVRSVMPLSEGRSQPHSAAVSPEVEAKSAPEFPLIPESEMSEGLMELLAEAEARLGDLPPAVVTRTRRLQPEAEVEAVLPADILAGLDEDLDFEEDRAFPNPITTGHSSNVSGGESEVPVPAADLPTSGKLELPSIDRLTPPPSRHDSAHPDPRRAVTTPPPQRASESASAESRKLASEIPLSEGTAIEHAAPSVSAAAWESVKPSQGKDVSSTTPPRRPSVTAAGIASKWPSDTPAPKQSEMPDTPRARGSLSHSNQDLSARNPAPDVLAEDIVPGDLIATLGRLIRTRYTGALALDSGSDLRRIVLREGDFVIVSSAAQQESLVAFLVQRGSLSLEAAQQLGHRLPHFGRHAGAALIAHGHLRQDELWSVLRAHAEWLLIQLIGLGRGNMTLEATVAERLREEPAVFGGATGAEVLVELVRRAVEPSQAVSRLGGVSSLLSQGAAWHLLTECALNDAILRELRQIEGTRLGDFLERMGAGLASVLYALAALGVVSTGAAELQQPSVRAFKKVGDSEPAREDLLDAEVLRSRIRSRMSLVEQGDYFAVLGVSRGATAYDIQKAYLALRQQFEPGLVLTPKTLDLRSQVETILDVLEEAHEILSDQVRRERYRRALEAAPR